MLTTETQRRHEYTWAFCKCQDCDFYTDYDDYPLIESLLDIAKDHVVATGHCVDFSQMRNLRESVIEPI